MHPARSGYPDNLCCRISEEHEPRVNTCVMCAPACPQKKYAIDLCRFRGMDVSKNTNGKAAVRGKHNYHGIKRYSRAVPQYSSMHIFESLNFKEAYDIFIHFKHQSTFIFFKSRHVTL